MQSGPREEYLLDELVFTQPALVFEHAVAFNAADGLFNPHAEGGNSPINPESLASHAKIHYTAVVASQTNRPIVPARD